MTVPRPRAGKPRQVASTNTPSDRTELDARTLESYLSGFFGYGNLDAPLWLIGMEEGGARDLLEVQRRIASWAAHRTPCLDLADHHHRFGQGRWFAPGAPTQSTWRALIRLALRARSDTPVDIEHVRAYQIAQLGRSGGNLALLELLPLPKPSRRDWRYARWSSLPCLASPYRYEKHMAQLRVPALRRLIAVHRPRVVVFYGLGFAEYWDAIAGAGPLSCERFVDQHHRDGTVTSYLQLAHPVARGAVNLRFEQAGDLIRTAGLLGRSIPKPRAGAAARSPAYCLNCNFACLPHPAGVPA